MVFTILVSVSERERKRERERTCLHMHHVLQKPEESVRSLGIGVMGGCKPPAAAGAGNRTLFFGKSNAYS